MKKPNVNKVLQECSKNLNSVDLFNAMRPYQEEHLTPTTLGMCFENMAEPKDGHTKWIEVDDLVQTNKTYRSNNGCQWARSDQGYLGNKYKVERKHEKGKVSAVRLNGFR